MLSAKGRPAQQFSLATSLRTLFANPAVWYGPVPSRRSSLDGSGLESAMRNPSPASNAGSTGMGESLVNTIDPPRARTASHGQLFGHEAFSEATTFTEVTGVPSLKRTPGRSLNSQR